MTGPAPDLRVERALLREHGGPLAAMDEVGRGALAGPVCVGVVVIDASTPPAPPDVRDSKLLTPSVREALVPEILAWALDAEVGHASNAEIDALGIVAAMRRAGRRALAALAERGTLPVRVLLDGSHDWLTPPSATLFDADIEADSGVGAERAVPVTTRVKADLVCASVAAASVLAKVERDAVMADAHRQYPAYGWAENKGYASPAHREALTRLGSCSLHRRSWALGTTVASDDASSTGGRGVGGLPQGSAPA